MKIEISGTRTNVILEGDAIEIMLDLAELNAPTLDGRKLLKAFREQNENNQTISKTDYALETGVEVGFILRPLMFQFIIVITLLDNGEYMTKVYKDTNSKPYISLFNYCNGKRD